RVRLLLIPLGTGNDFARTLDLPWDPAAAVGLLDRGQERRVDLVHCRSADAADRYIINAATGGFSEQVHQRLDPDMKKQWGPLAYLRAAVQAMGEVCSYDARV